MSYSLKMLLLKGGRVAEALSVLSEFECKVLGVTSLVDRSAGTIDFGVPFKPLMRLEFPTYQPENLPADLAAIPPIKPGS